jgi:post-segregation antitoxin (ccd killing protein)
VVCKHVRMARVNVYLPDELAEEARAAGLNVSSMTQEALRRELARRRTSTWLERVRELPPTGVSHEQALEVIDAARDDIGDRFG